MAKKLAEIEREAEENPYERTGGKRLIAQMAGDLPNQPHSSTNPNNIQGAETFLRYGENLQRLLRSVLLYWTPGRLETEALKRAGEVESPSSVAQEHHLFMAVFLDWSEMLYSWVPGELSKNFHARRAGLLQQMLEASLGLLERKAASAETRAMDLRLRWDHERLAKVIAGQELSSKLAELIEAARDGAAENRQHLERLSEAMVPSIRKLEQALGSMAQVQDWTYDHVLLMEAKKPGALRAAGDLVAKGVSAALVKQLFEALLEMARQH